MRRLARLGNCTHNMKWIRRFPPMRRPIAQYYSFKCVELVCARYFLSTGTRLTPKVPWMHHGPILVVTLWQDLAMPWHAHGMLRVTSQEACHEHATAHLITCHPCTMHVPRTHHGPGMGMPWSRHEHTTGAPRRAVDIAW